MAAHCRAPSVFPTVLSGWDQAAVDAMAARGCNCSELLQANNVTNLVCDRFPFVHDWWVQVVYFTLFTFIIVMAAGGNLTVIWIVLAHRRMRTVTNYFLLNLAAADASISIFNVCFSFTFNFYYIWVFGEHYCVFNNFMGIVPTCASVFTLMTLSCDRYNAIVHPLRPRLSQRATVGLIAAIWALACVCGIPMVLYSQEKTFYFYDGRHVVEDPVCLSDAYPDGNAQTSRLFSAYQFFLLGVNYILPLVVLSFTYAMVARELWFSDQIGDHRHLENIKAKRKIVKMLFGVVAIFMTCWLPYHIYFTLLFKQFANQMSPLTALYIFLNMYWLAMSSTIFNPIIYCWMNSRFRTGFRYAFRWLPCVSVSAEEYALSSLFDHRRSSHGATMDSRGRPMPTIRGVGGRTSVTSDHPSRFRRSFDCSDAASTAAAATPASFQHGKHLSAMECVL